ncbi:hypothetical protein HOO65_011351 [Ceratocystis lukuohia]|uniref:Inhibitor I9 domain-containing protein n=2 Tax=Ceratocystis TaxID=5157 RepID=A0A2C5XEP9_9PEZI|nr:hypothetical protein CFIMG_002921RA [Ceratocystis fimbriata CBS 114723]
MRPFVLLATGIAIFQGASALNLGKVVMVTYEDNAPNVQALMKQAIDIVLEAGGEITHRSTLYSGFFAQTSREVAISIKRLGGSHVAVELDGKAVTYPEAENSLHQTNPAHKFMIEDLNTE